MKSWQKIDWIFFGVIIILFALVLSVSVRAAEVPCVYKVAAENINAYRLVQNLGPTSVGTLHITIGGSVPVGTVCDFSQATHANGVTYLRIPRTAVNWQSFFNRPATMWAVCVADPVQP